MSMPLSSGQVDSFLDRGFTRGHIGSIASVMSSGAALPFYNEFAVAQEAERRVAGRTRMPIPPGRSPDQF